MTPATIDDELAARVGPSLRAAFPTAGPPALTRMPTGMSSLTYSVAFTDDQGPRRIAVKAAPPGLAPVRNRDVLRQARLLRALADAPGVVVPIVLFEDAGDPPDEPPLFGMTFVEGECFEPLSDEGDPPPPAVVIDRARSATEMLAALHGLDPAEQGLGDEPEIALADEVERWVRLFEAVGDELRPETARPCGERLAAARPEPLPTALVHGDYRLGNIIFDGRRPAAIIDWEIWSRGDPRIDLAWFLLNSDPRKPNATRQGTGMPAVEELAAGYEARRGAPVPDLDWFHALVRFKQAAASAFIVKNNRKRDDPDPRKERILAHIPALLDGAHEHLDRATG